MEENDAVSPQAGMRQGIQSVEIAMTVLEALEHGGGPMSLSDIAARSALQPSKVHRYLVSLTRIGLASQAPGSGLYDLGPSMRRLGAEALRRTNEVATASEYAPLLRDATGHSVNLTVWSDEGPVVVRWDYGSHALSLSVRVGATLPLFTSSAGRVFLAYLPERMTAAAVQANLGAAASLPLGTADIAEIVRDVRARGLALTTGGVIPGISSISAPIFAASDALPLAMTVVFPREEMDESEVASVQQKMLETTESISRELGDVARSATPTIRSSG
ncbi:IclR family transcriptional regulator [uncultured Microbacterium sp.]|uniref:IclR family transcriptional regulator n=1 Tax=uncultured Microbacterium sp. TaxID=191216 RepID=UPI0035CC6E5E